MHTRKFFLVCLSLPLMIILMATLIGYFSHMALPLDFANTLTIPYLCFSAAMIAWCKHERPSTIRRLAYGAPIIFLLFQIAFLVMQYIYGNSLASDLLGLGGLAIFSATYIVILGYVYVFIAEQVFLSYLANKRSQLKSKLHTKNALINGKLPC